MPPSFAAETLVCPLDDEAALDALFAEHGRQLAAAIVEPLPGNNGLLQQRQEWLEHLRALCTEHGALLIFDEVISGFRGQYGGFGDAVGVPADLITLGKIIGGGLPVGALAGPREIMEQLAPSGGVYQAGTLSGNPVSLAAGTATLDVLKTEGLYDQLEELGAVFDRTFTGSPWLQHRRAGSLIWLYLAEGDIPRAAHGIDSTAIERFNRIHAPLLDRGIYLPPSGYEVLFLSAAHTPAQIERLATSLAELADA